MTDQKRQPAGAPDGGQFAPTEGSESAAALTDAGSAIRAARRAELRSRRAARAMTTAVEFHMVHGNTDVDISRQSEDAETIDFGHPGFRDPQPGTIAALATIDSAIQYADDDTFGHPGWRTEIDGVEVHVLDESSYVLRYETQPAGGVAVKFTGVTDVRAALRHLTDTAAAAQHEYERAEDGAADRWPMPPWR